jgi:hypothetical protein
MYLLVSSFFHIPFVSLLPSNALTKNALIVSPTPKMKPTSVKKVIFANGQYYFEVRGKFPSKPDYRNNILFGEFVIDEDPNNTRIPVMMTVKGGKINVGRSQGSFSGTTIWKLEDTDVLLAAIKPNEPAQLRIRFLSSVLSQQDQRINSMFEGIINGNWSIPDNIVLNPPMVGVVQ